jgi:hypothetical protein
MRDQKHSSFPTERHQTRRQIWRPDILMDQLMSTDHSSGDDATGLTDWIRIWDQAPWQRT